MEETNLARKKETTNLQERREGRRWESRALENETHVVECVAESAGHLCDPQCLQRRRASLEGCDTLQYAIDDMDVVVVHKHLHGDVRQVCQLCHSGVQFVPSESAILQTAQSCDVQKGSRDGRQSRGRHARATHAQ